MSLVEYRRKRDFKKTAEPRGKPRKRSGHSFVIQKHAASHLHYDFRLEFDGVLKSWAVPKGPSLDPKVKRLAMEVEDHPLEYGKFEGIIPAGEYGGGTVMLWDRGHWDPEGDAQEDYRAGKLKFTLHGEKLHGRWMLLRTRGTGSKPQWLLFKERDDEAKDATEFDITEKEPLSVATGRDLDEIAEQQDRIWGSNRVNGKIRPKIAKIARVSPGGRRNLRSKSKRPSKISPQLPTLVDSAPSGDEWLHEIKFDGYRMICHADGGDVRFETRNHLDWTAKLPELAAAVGKLKLKRTVLDGEVVAINPRGIPDFQSLQNAFQSKDRGNVVFTVFDLLFLDGVDLRDWPLEERKAALAQLKLPNDRGFVRYTDYLEGNGSEFFAQAERNGLEGIISKRRDRPYRSGRGTDWVKVKAQQRAEFVVGGYTDPGGSRQGFGSLLVGYYDKDGDLKYAGRVGTGFNDRLLADLLAKLRKLDESQSPFAGFPKRGAAAKGVHWVRPKFVAEVQFSSWTRDDLLRHPSFQGLREDKPASAITREVATHLGGGGLTQKKSAKRKNVAKPRLDQARNRQAGSRRGGDETEIADVRVTHPDKVLWPDVRLTKRDLAEYFVANAEHILPHVADRPLSIVRCPDGIEAERFFQKHPGAFAPKELRRVRIRERTGIDTYLVADNVQALVALAQISAVELHVWGSKVKSLERPDRMVLDLDPAPDVKWNLVRDAAIEIRDFLKELGLESFVKTSGGKGLHLVVPLVRRHSWDEIDDFSHAIAQAVERAAPERYVSKMSKRARVGKIYVDYLRNQRGSTAVAAFSTRARPGAAVSMPIAWRELSRITSGDQFHLPDVRKRLSAQRHDPWAGIDEVQQSITAKMRKTLGL